MMGRKKEYSPEFVIDAAMRTFWKKGYEGTTVRDLAKSSGLTTRSMYNAFSDKDKFFEAALDRYQERILEPIIQFIESGKGFASLREFVALLGKEATSDGCLFMNTAASRHMVGNVAVDKVEKYVKRLKKTVRVKLEEAANENSYHGDLDQGATQFVLAILGFNLALKTGIPKKEAASALIQMINYMESR